MEEEKLEIDEGEKEKKIERTKREEGDGSISTVLD